MRLDQHPPVSIPLRCPLGAKPIAGRRQHRTGLSSGEYDVVKGRLLGQKTKETRPYVTETTPAKRLTMGLGPHRPMWRPRRKGEHPTIEDWIATVTISGHTAVTPGIGLLVLAPQLGGFPQCPISPIDLGHDGQFSPGRGPQEERQDAVVLNPGVGVDPHD